MRDRMRELVASVPPEERPMCAMAVAIRELRRHPGDEANATADTLEAEAALATLERIGWELRPAREPDASALRAQVARLAEISATAEVPLIYARRLLAAPWWRFLERRRRMRLLARVMRWHDGRAAP